jgi:cytochrome c peroxidase
MISEGRLISMKAHLGKTGLSLLVVVCFIPPLYRSAPGTFSGLQTDSLSGQAGRVFGRLPSVMDSGKNPVTPEKVKLGKILFYETRISIDGTVSCSKCHPIGRYAADGLRKSIGSRCALNPRNAPTILNAAAQISEHWIGNRTDVEDQARQSVVGPASFGMPSPAEVEKKLKEIRGYAPLFKEAFPQDTDPVTVDNLAKAVGAFERTLVTPSPFDAFLAGNNHALAGQEKRGLKIFMDVGCTMCHSGAYVGGRTYQKFGLIEPYGKYTKSEVIDEGRYAVTKMESDRYVFKVPVLRNVARTAPYFHDGSVDGLEMAEWIMGKVQLGKDLSQVELEDINAFLKSLTGRIPEDALKLPLLPSME